MPVSDDDVLAARTLGLIEDKIQGIEANLVNAALQKLSTGELTPEAALQSFMQIYSGRLLVRSLKAAERRVKSGPE